MDTEQESDLTPYDLIMEVGAEGGSLRLMATRQSPPLYAAFLDDQTLTYIGEGDAIHMQSTWGTWQQAIRALGKYPWQMLSARVVDPGYAARIWPLLEPRWDEMRESVREKWARLCGQSAEAPEFDTGPVKRGDRVVHPAKPEWGVASILQDGDGNNVRLFFEIRGDITLSSNHVRLRRVRGEAARSLVLDNLKMQNGRPSVNYRSVPASIAYFLQEFPGGFAGERFDFHERKHKRQIHMQAKQELGKPVFEQLLSEGRHSEVVDRALHLISAQRNALIHLHEKLALSNGLQDSDVGKKLFAERLFTVLHGEGEFAPRFDAWSAALEDIGAAKWPIATYFLFFMHPDRYMFVKPTITQYAADICAFDINYRSEVNSKTYTSILAFSAYLKEAIAELDPVDMIDVQSFMWCIAPGTYATD